MVLLLEEKSFLIASIFTMFYLLWFIFAMVETNFLFAHDKISTMLALQYVCQHSSFGFNPIWQDETDSTSMLGPNEKKKR